MKQNSIFIDLTNKEQVLWWNNIASKLVKVVYYETIVETATNQPRGIIIMLKGLRKGQVIRENLRFIAKPVTMTLKREL